MDGNNYNYFLFPEKLILEKLDLQELAETATRDTSGPSQCYSPRSSRLSSSPCCSGEQSQGVGSHGDRKRGEDTAASLPGRKRMQTEEQRQFSDCLPQDTSSVNVSKRLRTSRYFSSPEDDCADADLDLDF